MRTGSIILLAALASALPTTPQAAPRTSPNYRIPAEAVDGGGRATSSTNYRNIGSARLIGGKAASAGGAVTINGGYIAQVAGTNTPLVVVSAVSRKVHGSSSTFDIALPLNGPAGIECRNPGAGGSHQVVVTFTTAVTVGGLSVTSIDGMASGTRSVSGAAVTVNLNAVANAQTLGITLLNVSNGSSAGNIFIPIGILLGDTSANGTVNSTDVSQTKLKSGQVVDATSFRSDVTLSNSINATDVGTVKLRVGTALP